MINNDFFCVLDTETGGLHPQNNPVCEIAFVILNNKLEQVDQYSAINRNYKSLDPDPITKKPEFLKYDPQALSTHGIPMREIEAGITIEESIKNMDNILSKYSKGRNKVIFVGHNFPFDLKMMKYAYNVAKRDIHKYTSSEYIYDTLKMSHLAWGHEDGMENFKLPTCCERIGINIADSHRALGDVLSTAELFKHHINNMRNTGTPSQSKSLEPKDKYSRSHTFKF